MKLVARELLPPIVLRGVRLLRSQPVGLRPAIDEFHEKLIPRGSLVFDVGANIGTRTASFLRLGLRVIAVEPQTSCCAILNAAFSKNPDFRLVRNALGRDRGTATMRISEISGVSTLSPQFIEATTKSGRFSTVHWDRTQEVAVITLDDLIVEYGTPFYVKIDVEGLELEVISGLSQPLNLVSLEWNPEFTDNVLLCIKRLCGMGEYQFNLCWGESMKLARTEWMSEARLAECLNFFREDSYLWADIFARRVL